MNWLLGMKYSCISYDGGIDEINSIVLTILLMSFGMVLPLIFSFSCFLEIFKMLHNIDANCEVDLVRIRTSRAML